MIPVILIVWTIDIFASFIKCPLHPEYSAPCSVNWIFAVMYVFFLLITTILAIISTKQLRKVKKKIESEFLDIDKGYNIKKKSGWNNAEKINETKNAIKNTLKSKRIIVNSESTLNRKSITSRTIKKINDTKKTSNRGKIMNK